MGYWGFLRGLSGIRSPKQSFASKRRSKRLCRDACVWRDDAPWCGMMNRDESSSCIMTIHHEASWWVIVMHRDDWFITQLFEKSMSGNGVDMRLYELIFWGTEATPLIYCYCVVINKLCVVDIMVILRFSRSFWSDLLYYWDRKSLVRSWDDYGFMTRLGLNRMIRFFHEIAMVSSVAEAFIGRLGPEEMG